MKSIKSTILMLLVSAFFSQPLLAAKKNPDFEVKVGRFVEAIASNDRSAIANLVAYPLQREVPLPSINNPTQFLEHFDEVLDEDLLKSIANSNIARDWVDMGWKGFMFRRGLLWLDTSGKILIVHYQTRKGEAERNRVIEADRRTLYSALRNYLEPVLEWKTKDYRIRIDLIGDEQYRYAVWPVNKPTSEKPDLVLNNGKLFIDGSGGNHYYDFKSGVFLYECYVIVIGAKDSPPGDLTVYKDGKKILNQPVTEVIK